MTNFVLITGMLFALPNLCKGQINPPSRGNSLVAAPGEDIQIDWTFDDRRFRSRSWYFTSSDGSSTERLAFMRNAKAITIENSSLPRVNVTPPATIVLRKVNMKYNGTYRFALDAPYSKFPRARSSVVTVFIAMKPTTEVECFTPTTVDRYDNIRCLCKSTGGFPQANHTWFKDGKEIISHSKLLSFDSICGSINGTYTCVAQSYTLKDEKSVEIRVRPDTPPVVKSFMSIPTQAILGKSVAIICKSDGRPQPDFNIFYNGSSTPVSTKNTYIISKVKYEDIGLYTCVAKNDVGRNSKNYTLKVVAAVSAKSWSESKSGIEWYIIFVAILAGVVVGTLLSYLVSCFRHRLRKRNSQLKPGTPTTKNISVYQDLDLRNMNQEDNYISVIDNVESDATYANLSKERDVEKSYQSLT